MSAWRAHVLGERSYPQNSTETQAYITKYLPAVHALTGCDTASYQWGIGKATALKVLMGGHHIIELDQHGADEDKLTSKAPSLLPVTDPQFKEI